VTLRSVSLLFQWSGNNDATVIKPRGIFDAFLDMNFKACLKLQYVSGYLGYINRIFIMAKDNF